MPHKLDNYLRTHRKRSGLSQEDVALLLGSTSRVRVSRHELLRRYPETRTIFAYEIIFGVPARKLFPGTYQKVERVTAELARTLAEELSSRAPSRALARKIATLRAIASQVTDLSESEERAA